MGNVEIRRKSKHLSVDDWSQRLGNTFSNQRFNNWLIKEEISCILFISRHSRQTSTKHRLAASTTLWTMLWICCPLILFCSSFSAQLLPNNKSTKAFSNMKKWWKFAWKIDLLSQLVSHCYYDQKWKRVDFKVKLKAASLNCKSCLNHFQLVHVL